jgi:hypothetical protein
MNYFSLSPNKRLSIPSKRDLIPDKRLSVLSRNHLIAASRIDSTDSKKKRKQTIISLIVWSCSHSRLSEMYELISMLRGNPGKQKDKKIMTNTRHDFFIGF